MHEKIARIAMLLDTYGGLLTEHQREVLRLRYDEDMSLGEIASQYDISRAAVQDILRRAETQLEEMEKNMGILRLRQTIRRNLQVAKSSLQTISQNIHDAGVEKNLAEVARIVQETLDLV